MTSTSEYSFAVVPVVISEYVDWDCLPAAEDEARRIAELLADWGGVVEGWDIRPEDRNLTTVTDRLDQWADSGQSRSSVLLWIGHGWSTGQEASLVVGGGYRDAELGPDELVRHVIREQRGRGRQDWAIVIIEACGAKRFGQIVHAKLHLSRATDGVLIVGSGSAQGRGYLASFRRALSRVRDTYFSNDTEISLSDLASRLNESLDPGEVFQSSYRGVRPIVVRRPAAPVLTTPVDVYDDLRQVMEKLSEQERLHFARAGTGAELLEFSWYFAGRTDERRRILDWFRVNRQGLLVVTGPPGSGKSALLGNVLLHARPEVRSLLSGGGPVGNEWPGAAELPPLDGSILLTGADLHQTIDALWRIAGLPASDVGLLASDERANALLGELAKRTDPLTLIADALDESQDPVRIGEFLNRISGVPGVRILLGTRPTPSRGLQGATSQDLLTAVSRGTAAVLIMTLERDAEALSEFSASRLRAEAAEVPPGELDRAVQDVVAFLEAPPPAVEAPGFLHTRLLVRELLSDADLLYDAGRERRLRLLELDRPGLFQRAVQRISTKLPSAEPFLRALAFARGRGLPRADRVWAEVAGVLAQGARFTDADLGAVLDAAGPYIMLDAEHGQSVFRLAHETFAEYMLAKPGLQADQARVLERLLSLAEETPTPSEDTPSPAEDTPELAPYLRHHLSGHALAAGPIGWSLLGQRPGVIDRLELRALLTDTWRARGDQLSAAITGACRTAHLAVSGDHRDRRGLRQLGMASGAQDWTADPDEPAGGAAWAVARAALRSDPGYRTLRPGEAPVRALAAVSYRSGDVVVISGDDAGQVRFWKPESGELVDGQGPRHDQEVLDLAAASISGTWRVVSVGAMQPIRSWDFATGALTGSFPVGLNDSDQTVALYADETGAALIAAGGSLGTIRSWELDSGQRRGLDLTGHRGLVTGLAILTDDAGRDQLASAGRDGTLRLWDLAEQRPVGSPRTSQGAPIRSLAFLREAWLLATGDGRGTVTCWPTDSQANDGGPVRTFAAHDGPVHALAEIPRADASPLLATAGADGVVRIWDPNTGRQAGPEFAGHGARVTSLVAVRADGIVRLVSGTDDGSVRIWRPLDDWSPAGRRNHPGNDEKAAEPSPISTLPPREWRLSGAQGEPVLVTSRTDRSVVCEVATGPVVSLARPDRPDRPGMIRCAATGDDDGRTVIATAEYDAKICTWHATTGQAAGPTLHGHTDWVGALAWLSFDGVLLLASGGDDRTLCFWQPSAGVLLRRIRLGQAIRQLETVGGELLVTLAEGEIVIHPLTGLLADMPRGQAPHA